MPNPLTKQLRDDDSKCVFTWKWGLRHIKTSPKWRTASVYSRWLVELLKKLFEAWKKTDWHQNLEPCTFQLMVVGREGLCNIRLQIMKGTTEKGIVWHGKLSLISSLWIDNPDICFLTKIPWIKVFCSDIPNSNIVEGDQNCRPCTRINLDVRQGKWKDIWLKLLIIMIQQVLYHSRYMKNM